MLHIAALFRHFAIFRVVDFRAATIAVSRDVVFMPASRRHGAAGLQLIRHAAMLKRHVISPRGLMPFATLPRAYYAAAAFAMTLPPFIFTPLISCRLRHRRRQHL